MLIYFAGNYSPEIAFAVHQWAWYTFCLKTIREKSFKIISCDQKKTILKGMDLRPSRKLKIDCYPDIDSAGLRGHGNSQDKNCSRRRTGCIVTVDDCPVLWVSKLQAETSLSTIKAKNNALSISMKELFFIIRLVKGLDKAIVISAE